jgi:protein-disulfide isomerase
MSSRAHTKAVARAARLAAEEQERRTAARRRALFRLAWIATLALVVVVAAALAAPTGERQETAAPAGSQLDGVRQDGIALGSASAPYVLTEFADLQCPFCASFSRDVLPTVVDRYVRTGRVRLELQVLSFLGEDSVRAGQMASAAAQQDRLWTFTEAFYRSQGAENSGYVTDDFLRRIGDQTPGLDVDSAFAARETPAAVDALEAANRAAGAAGADHTPAFYLRRGDGRLRRLEPEALTAQAFTAALDEALAR